MSIKPGRQLLHYRLIEKIGEGGMGQVWKATDTRLDRTVAIKTLPAELAHEPGLKERLEREARAISSLNHPHICTLYDVGSVDGIDFLVMEYLEGRTLADHMSDGPLPLDETMGIAVQIADALEKAHRQGVVHRDLKPGNVMLTAHGAKVLDFGLAKRTGLPGADADLGASPTVTRALTAESAIVGTLQYMAPEQLEGKEADARSDLFAFGAVLYEMASGSAPFRGASAASLIASIIREQPRPLEEVAPIVPRALDRLVRQCLAKDPDERWQTAGDLKRELLWLREAPAAADESPEASGGSTGSRREWVGWGVAGLLLLVLVFLVMRGPGSDSASGDASPRILQAVLGVPPGVEEPITGDVSPAVSPRGERVAINAGERLWVRSLDSVDFVDLGATDRRGGNADPFWSPDGRRIGFFVDQRLKVIDAGGGALTTLCSAPQGRGGTWNQEGTILFAPDLRTGIQRVSANGGEPVPVTTVRGPQHTTHRWPHFLPDGRQFLFLAADHANPRGPRTGIHLASLDGGEPEFLVRSDAGAIFDSGWLLYLRDGDLLGQRFDPESKTLDPEVRTVAKDVSYRGGSWTGMFSARDDVLAYQKRKVEVRSELTWIDVQGNVLGTLGDPELIWDVQFSPDGKRVAVAAGEPQPSIWIYEIQRNVSTRLTLGDDFSRFPIWSPDGERIAFASIRENGWLNVYVKPADGSGEESILLEAETDVVPTDWSPDGKHLALEYGPLGTGQVWMLPLEGERKPYPVVETPPWAGDAQFSPDGKWLAYVSRESGEDAVYVTRFPEGGGRTRISPTGFSQAMSWAPNGKLYMIVLGLGFLEVSVEVTDGKLRVAEPRKLFDLSLSYSTFMAHNRVIDLAPDGTRFLTGGDLIISTASSPVVFVTPWTVTLD